ncbi:MAG: hypothetical protein V4461_11055 [Pseudomonadota bacterium]|tara:strand:- start:3692 stop:4918 length:1227 start_codon:yes stop_codon:yes gene_type:complete
MGDPIIRPENSVAMFKLETTEGVDAGPTAADAFPFETGFSYNSPFASEQSTEITGSLVAGPPDVVGQAAEITFRCRMKGANVAYSASVKPPHHALLQAAGKRGLFTAAISAAALTAVAGDTATLASSFAATAQAYRGMPLKLTVGPGAGRTTFINDYTAARVATLADSFSPVLTTSTLAEILPNWTYAGTSPKDGASRATDHPSGTLYLNEDGVLRKYVGCRIVITEWGGDTAKSGFYTFKLMGIYAGKADVALPDVSVPLHSGPILAMGVSGIDPSFMINRKQLPIQNWSLGENGQQASPEDPNTPYGFGASQIGGRVPELRCNPLASLVAARDVEAEIAAKAQYPALIRAIGGAYNRWAITLPLTQPIEATPGTRGTFRSEEMRLRAMSPGKDAQARDGDSILCFW